ncbi:MAG TPA: hypothetical protein VLC98_06465 [Phnomibacter sp.]|nr:hypothetical protein [Phnomibacter sp.]
MDTTAGMVRQFFLPHAWFWRVMLADLLLERISSTAMGTWYIMRRRPCQIGYIASLAEMQFCLKIGRNIQGFYGHINTFAPLPVIFFESLIITYYE